MTIRPWLQLVLFWSLNATPVGLVFVAFSRPVRGTVGPLFVTTALIMVVSAFIVVDVTIGSPFGRGLV